MNKYSTLNDKLKSYSLLTGSILASSLVAQAQVIYTDVNPDVELGGSVPLSYPQYNRDTLDLNNDGVLDFKISLTIYGTDPGVAGLSFLEKIDGAFNPLSNQVLNYTIDYHPWVFHLECGDSIPINLPNFSWSYANFAFQFPSNAAMNWNNVHDEYVGVKFKSSDGFHFGWVKVDVNTADTIPNIVIKSYAYEATPNKKIASCDLGLANGINVPKTKELSIAPNPSNGQCVISFGKPLQENAEVFVNDMQGRRVFRTMIPANSSNELPLDLSTLAAGAYLVQVKSENNLLSAKWIKK